MPVKDWASLLVALLVLSKVVVLAISEPNHEFHLPVKRKFLSGILLYTNDLIVAPALDPR